MKIISNKISFNLPCSFHRRVCCNFLMSCRSCEDSQSCCSRNENLDPKTFCKFSFFYFFCLIYLQKTNVVIRLKDRIQLQYDTNVVKCLNMTSRQKALQAIISYSIFPFTNCLKVILIARLRKPN